MPVPINTNAQVQELITEFVIKGGYRLQLDETVVPVAVVAELSRISEVAAFAGDRLSAVNRMTFSLYNPTGSGILVYVDSIIMNVGATAVVYTGFGGTILANDSGTNTFNDLRNPNAPNATLRYEDLAAVPAGGNARVDLAMNSNSIFEMRWREPLIIPENQQWWCQQGAAGNFSVAARWREVRP